MRRIFEYIFSEDFAGRPGSPLDRSGTPIKDEPGSQLAQSFFPEMYFPELLNPAERQTLRCRSARR
jgi:hypothetical protein